jgi:hypothetical protein
MPSDIVFETFRTHRHPYAYDRHLNPVIMLPEDDYQKLLLVRKGEIDAEESPVIEKYRNEGLFMPNSVSEIEHYGTVAIEQYTNTRMKQLVLQVTQQCNLRCEYCAYLVNGARLGDGIAEMITYCEQRFELDVGAVAISRTFFDIPSEDYENMIYEFPGKQFLDKHYPDLRGIGFPVLDMRSRDKSAAAIRLCLSRLEGNTRSV